MRETVRGRRKIPLLLQVAREDAATSVAEIANRLALRDPGK